MRREASLLAVAAVLVTACQSRMGRTEAPRQAAAPVTARAQPTPRPTPTPDPMGHWTLRQDGEALQASLRASTLESHGLKESTDPQERPVLSLACRKGKVDVSLQSPLWTSEVPIMASFDGEAGISFYATLRAGGLHPHADAFLRELRGRERFGVRYAPHDLLPGSGYYALFETAGLEAVAAAFEKTCPLAAVAARVSAKAGGEKAEPVWSVQRQFSTRGEGGIVMVQKGKGKGELYVRCRWDGTEVFLSGNEVLENDEPVSVRFDDGQPQRIKATPSTNFQALFLPGPRQRIASFLGRRSVTMRYTAYGSKESREETFDLTGFDDLIGPFRKACGLPAVREARS